MSVDADGRVATAGYVPDIRIRINDQDLPAAVRSSILSVRYEDGLNAADRVEVELADVDLRWLSSHVRGIGVSPFPRAVKVGPVRAVDTAARGTFDLDNTLSLSLGYAGGRPEAVFTGNVTGLSADFPADRPPTLTLVAHDRLHRLAQGTASRCFGLLPDFLIASILAAENLLIPIVDPAVVAASTAMAAINAAFAGAARQQRGTSDLEMLAEIARSYDADFWVEGDVLHLSRIPRETTPRLTLRWGRSLLELSPRVSTVGQIAAVAAHFALKEIPLDFVVTVSWDFDREALGISVTPGANLGAGAPGGVLTLLGRSIAGPGDIADSAVEIIRELRQRLNNRITATGAALGDPRIRAGALLRLEGLGPDFSGDYRVASSTHVFDGNGYRTGFELRREIFP